MSDDVQPAAPAEGAPATAGGLLRQARQARGIHIAALAASMKVTPQKLEALEADRFDELPGATFTRALAQTMCRTLKVDAGPVLALLPTSVDKGLERMSRGLNEPFRDRPGRQPPADLAFLKSPVTLGAIALAVLAVAVYLLPAGWVTERLPSLGGASSPAADAPGADGAAPGLVTETVVGPGEPVVPPSQDPSASETVFNAPPAAASAPPGEAAPAAFAPSVPAPSAVAPSAAASVPAGALMLRATAESWVEVVDPRGVAVFSRMLQPGETVGLDGASPLRLKIGNAAATEVTYKGARVDLAPVTSRGNVAKLELR